MRHNQCWKWHVNQLFICLDPAPLVEASIMQDVVFWTISLLLTYNFYKAWKSDPGFIRTDRTEKVKVGKAPAIY